MKTRRNAFTLVELLVVIGILLVLISILFPFVNKAMDRAKTVQCLGNMRRWSQAASEYLVETGILPGEGMQGGGIAYDSPDAWFNVLATNVGVKPLSLCVRDRVMPRPGPKQYSAWFCPEFKMSDLENPPGSRDMVFTYAYNLWIDHDKRSQSSHSDNPGIPNYNLRIDHIEDPANFVILGEVASTEFDNMAARHIVYRHNNKQACNMCFADGSARTYEKEEVYVPPAGEKDVNKGVIWDPAGTYDL